MNKRYSRDDIVYEISRLGAELVETRQVLKRLRKLLPTQLNRVALRYRKSHTPGRAVRKALLDADYSSFLTEVNQLSASVLESKLKREKYYRRLELMRQKNR